MLDFSDKSRTYETAGDRIKFWGKDGTANIPFFLDVNTLFRLYPRTANTEAAILMAFDAARQHFQEMASRAHAKGRRTFYVLSADSL
jgi:hypothetical protein